MKVALTRITPNQITIARILLLPVGIYAILKDGGQSELWRYIASTIFVVIGLTDLLDGKLARSRGQVTPLGTLLDPIADKLMIAAAMIPLSALNLFPWWATIAILFREIGITLFRGAVLRSGVIPANRGGKIKTFMQNFGIGWFMLPLPSFLNWFKFGWLYVALSLTYITGYWYLRSFIIGRKR